MIGVIYFLIYGCRNTGTVSQKFPSILNSELAVQVLQQIAQSNPGNYSTRIAQELDTPQSSISRVIRELSELGFTEKGKRGKAQYYEADYRGIAEFWFQKIESELEDQGREKEMQVLRENEEKIKDLNIRFTKKMLQDCNIAQKNLQNIIFDDFLSSLAANAIKEENFFQKHHHLEPVKESLIHLLRVEGHPEEFRESLEDLQS